MEPIYSIYTLYTHKHTHTIFSISFASAFLFLSRIFYVKKLSRKKTEKFISLSNTRWIKCLILWAPRWHGVVVDTNGNGKCSMTSENKMRWETAQSRKSEAKKNDFKVQRWQLRLHFGWLEDAIAVATDLISSFQGINFISERSGPFWKTKFRTKRWNIQGCGIDENRLPLWSSSRKTCKRSQSHRDW